MGRKRENIDPSVQPGLFDVPVAVPGDRRAEYAAPKKPTTAEMLKKANLNFEPHTRHRVNDIETSRAAARRVASDAGALKDKQMKVLMILKLHPQGLTDEELTAHCAYAYGWNHGSTARTRRAELTHPKIGLVESTGRRKKLSSGSEGTVWRASREEKP